VVSLFSERETTSPRDGDRAEDLDATVQGNLAARAASKRSNCKGPPGLPCAVTPQGTWPPCSIESKRDHNGAHHKGLSSCGQFPRISLCRKCLDVNRHTPPSFLILWLRGNRVTLLRMSQQLPPIREAPNGNSIDRSSCPVFARRRWLGIFPLAQELALSLCQQ
jgi:hypothetical protein